MAFLKISWIAVALFLARTKQLKNSWLEIASINEMLGQSR